MPGLAHTAGEDQSLLERSTASPKTYITWRRKSTPPGPSLMQPNAVDDKPDRNS